MMGRFRIRILVHIAACVPALLTMARSKKPAPDPSAVAAPESASTPGATAVASASAAAPAASGEESWAPMIWENAYQAARGKEPDRPKVETRPGGRTSLREL